MVKVALTKACSVCARVFVCRRTSEICSAPIFFVKRNPETPATYFSVVAGNRCAAAQVAKLKMLSDVLYIGVRNGTEHTASQFV